MSAVGNTIIARGDHKAYDEGMVVTATITPGMLVSVSVTEDGDFQRPKVIRQTPANADAEIAFAIEDGIIGKTIDDAYAVGDICRYVTPRPGDEAWIFVKAGENITIGDTLTFGAAGTLVEESGSMTKGVAVALQTLDLTALAATRVKVRFI